MQAKTLSLLAALLLGISMLAVRAQTPQDYIASAAVTDQGAEARDKGLRDTLATVLSRAGGPQASGARVAPLMARPDVLVKQYDYANNDKGELQITVTFDQAAVDAALKAQGLPVWGIASGPVDEVSVSIGGITTPRAYARVLDYLRNQPGIKTVSMVAFAVDTMHLRIRSEGGAARLAGALSVGNVLKPGDSSDPRELAYRLQN